MIWLFIFKYISKYANYIYIYLQFFEQKRDKLACCFYFYKQDVSRSKKDSVCKQAECSFYNLGCCAKMEISLCRTYGACFEKRYIPDTSASCYQSVIPTECLFCTGSLPWAMILSFLRISHDWTSSQGTENFRKLVAYGTVFHHSHFRFIRLI